MKIIDRYVGFGVLGGTSVGVLILSLVLVVGNVFKQLLDLIINHDVPAEKMFLFMAYVLPFSFTFTIPWGFLTAILLFFGRMSADNEIVALRASGVSIVRISMPVFALAVALSALCFWINFEVAPRAEQAMARTIYEIATNEPDKLFTADEVIDKFPDRRIYPGDKHGGTLLNVVVFEYDGRGVPTKVIHAKEGEIIPEEEDGKLALKLKIKNAKVELRDSENPEDFALIRQGIEIGEGVFPMPLDRFYDRYLRDKRISAYTLGELRRFIWDGAGGEILNAQTEYNKRFSISLACLAFVFIAIPLGVVAHRKETSIGFALSLAVAFSYFFFITIADMFRDNPAAHPTWLIWAPNFIFIPLGLFLFWRITRR